MLTLAMGGKLFMAPLEQDKVKVCSSRTAFSVQI
jgi:hypothetical protein